MPARVHECIRKPLPEDLPREAITHLRAHKRPGAAQKCSVIPLRRMSFRSSMWLSAFRTTQRRWRMRYPNTGINSD
jgi:hypothetical protein